MSKDVLKELDRVLSKVLKRIVVSEEEYDALSGYLNDVVNNIREMVSPYIEDPSNDIFIGGSFPRRTFIKDDFDIDIFVRFPPGLKREALKEIIFSIAIDIFGEEKVRERYADHPYAEIITDGMRINIVPAYKTLPPNWLSPVDRSYFHMLYLRENLEPKLVEDVLLLKSFFKGIRCYGAEISIKGFSGYLTELLTIYYSGFKRVISGISKWRSPVVIDIENHYRSREAILDMFSNAPLIVIDPVDKARNVASALDKRNFAKAISASKALLENPKKEFFYPYSLRYYKRYLSDVSLKHVKRMPILMVILTHNEKIEDIFYGQLDSLSRKIKRQIELQGVDVLKTSVFSDYRSKSVIFYLLSSDKIPMYYKKLGPPCHIENEKDFLIKNKEEPLLWIGKDGRWVIVRKRFFEDVKDFLVDLLNIGAVKLPSEVRDTDIYVLYLSEADKGFISEIKTWLSMFIKGEGFWRTFY
jgi:tRNA nucleotidyltransferase (CCA-adding enzyme)